MERSYLLLFFAAAFFLVLLIWGLYSHYSPRPAPPTTQPATAETLVDRLRAERERRLQQRIATTTTQAVQ